MRSWAAHCCETTMDTHLETPEKKIKPSWRKGRKVLPSWEIRKELSSLDEASHSVVCKVMLGLQDLLSIAVVLCRRWTKHTLLAQNCTQTKVIIKDYYCGFTGLAEQALSFLPIPTLPVPPWEQMYGGYSTYLTYRPQAWALVQEKAVLAAFVSPYLFSSLLHTTISLPLHYLIQIKVPLYNNISII